jgi:hypothetical protein
MDFEKLKNLEELKEQLAELQKERVEKDKQVMNSVVLSGVGDFRRFFEDKGFEVVESLNTFGEQQAYRLNATYKSLSAELSYTLPIVPLVGARFRYDLSMSLGKRITCGILIMSLTKGKPFSSPIFSPKMDEDDVDRKIREVKKDIEEHKLAPSPNAGAFGFFVREDDKMPDFSNGFQTLYNLLEFLTN